MGLNRFGPRLDVGRISAKDGQNKQSNDQEWAEKTALLQELVKVVPDEELPKSPYKEGDQRPGPQLGQETQDTAGLPGQRREATTLVAFLMFAPCLPLEPAILLALLMPGPLPSAQRRWPWPRQ